MKVTVRRVVETSHDLPIGDPGFDLYAWLEKYNPADHDPVSEIITVPCFECPVCEDLHEDPDRALACDHVFATEQRRMLAAIRGGHEYRPRRRATRRS